MCLYLPIHFTCMLETVQKRRRQFFPFFWNPPLLFGQFFTGQILHHFCRLTIADVFYGWALSIDERIVTNHIDFLLYIFSPALIRKEHVYEVDKKKEKSTFTTFFPASLFVLRQQKCILLTPNFPLITNRSRPLQLSPKNKWQKCE